MSILDGEKMEYTAPKMQFNVLAATGGSCGIDEILMQEITSILGEDKSNWTEEALNDILKNVGGATALRLS